MLTALNMAGGLGSVLSGALSAVLIAVVVVLIFKIVSKIIKTLLYVALGLLIIWLILSALSWGAPDAGAAAVTGASNFLRVML